MGVPSQSDADGGIAVEQEADRSTRTQPARPKFYKVLLHNDDFTTMEFVIRLLETLFSRPHDEAYEVMLSVHQLGVGVAGIYPYEIADTKAHQATEMARAEEFPLLVTLEPEHNPDEKS